MDKERRAYYEFFTDQKWMDMGQYDLCIDSSKVQPGCNYTDYQGGRCEGNSKVGERTFPPLVLFRDISFRNS